ncbi:MAG: hypothetical protein PSX81_08785 [bacterium]|nr:hypothetical protein [bacterium]
MGIYLGEWIEQKVNLDVQMSELGLQMLNLGSQMLKLDVQMSELGSQMLKLGLQMLKCGGFLGQFGRRPLPNPSPLERGRGKWQKLNAL